MIRIGTEVLFRDSGGFLYEGRVERNSLRTGRHLVRVVDMWFDRADVLIDVRWEDVDWT